MSGKIDPEAFARAFCAEVAVLAPTYAQPWQEIPEEGRAVLIEASARTLARFPAVVEKPSTTQAAEE